jgi:putative ABC transport system permease protein
MARLSFWIRWSLRHLKARWVQVTVIAMVIAIGTGVFAGLASQSAWLRITYDKNYAALSAHDLHVSISAGSYVKQGELADTLSSMKHPEWIALAEERLLQPTEVEVSTGSGTVLVAGRLVGVPTSDGNPRVDKVYVASGRGFDKQGGAVLEQHFVNQEKLPAEGTVKLAGGATIKYTGTGYSPEYFVITAGQAVTGQSNVMMPGDFAVLFMPLGVVQNLTGKAGEANDLVIRLASGTNRKAAKAEVEQAFAARFPQLAVQVTTLEEDPAYQSLYGQMNNNRGLLLGLAVLILLGAAFAAFNLASRVVEAERREIGISMALGSPRSKTALRPLLMGAEIAALGVVFGMGMGFLMGALIRPVLSSMQPLPFWQTPFQFTSFAWAAAIGFVLPFLATAWPVWRAVRVEPVQAIQTGHLAHRSKRLAPLLKRVHLPGRSLAQMPLRNVLRAPRRTILTALGIGASILLLIATLGALDSFNAVFGRATTEMSRGAPNWALVALTNFQPQDSDLIRTIEANPSVGTARPMMLSSAKVSKGDKELDNMMLQVLDMSSPVWNPTVNSRVSAGGLPGIVLTEKAASNLGVKPGDTLTLTHPYRTGETTFALKQSEVRLVGLNPMPARMLAFMDISSTGLFGLEGFANGIQVAPAAGHSITDVKNAIFNLPGVAATQAPSTLINLVKDKIAQVRGMFRVVAVIIFLLALLIALSSASISADEHRREDATIQAYGVPVHSLMIMEVVESGMVGLLGWLVGLGLGALALAWLLSRVATVMPDVQVKETLTYGTIFLSFLVGIVATAVAPLFNTRKLRKMDIPSTLRVME